MSVQVSICGLVAVPSWEPYRWQTAFYHEELSQIDPAVAQGFAENRLRQETEFLQFPDARLLISTIHPLYIPRCEGIAYADLEVNGDEEVSRFPSQSVHTVCGIYLDNGQTYSSYWMSHGPKMAYLDAWMNVRDEEARTLLVTCVHQGQLDKYEDLDFAYPGYDEAEMKDFMRTLVPTMVS